MFHLICVDTAWKMVNHSFSLPRLKDPICSVFVPLLFRFNPNLYADGKVRFTEQFAL